MKNPFGSLCKTQSKYKVPLPFIFLNGKRKKERKKERKPKLKKMNGKV